MALTKETTMKLKTLAFATLMAFGGAAFAQAPVTGVVAADKAAVASDKAAIKTDKVQLKTDAKAGDKTAVAADKATLKADRAQLKKDKAKKHAHKKAAATSATPEVPVKK
jgi:hypothetical protein